VADYFERVEDERFEMLTITGVEVDNDLNRAQVFVSDLGYVRPPEDEESDEVLLDALADHRKPVQAKIGRESRIRKTPEVVFAIDPGVRAGARIEEILSDLRDGEDTGSQDIGPPDSDPTPEDGATVEGDGLDDGDDREDKDWEDKDGDDHDEASNP
jgi:ribosome-binding factor A